MAMYQAKLVKSILMDYQPSLMIELVLIKSDGDMVCSKKNVFDGKGVFVKKLDEALLSGAIDFSVNCMKDIPHDHERNPKIDIVAVLPREDIRDVLILRRGENIPNKTTASFCIGTSSPRRKAIIQTLFPQATVKELRGSCDTRVKKLDAGEVDALILAKAGLGRIDLMDRINEIYEPEVFLPPWGAGIITLDALKNNQPIISLLKNINHEKTYQAMLLERAFVNAIQGNCHTPMGGYIDYLDDGIRVYGAVFSEAGDKKYTADVFATTHDDPRTVGAMLAETIKAQKNSV
jgi:hydroxymethylbilane synthase